MEVIKVYRHKIVFFFCFNNSSKVRFSNLYSSCKLFHLYNNTIIGVPAMEYPDKKE